LRAFFGSIYLWEEGFSQTNRPLVGIYFSLPFKIQGDFYAFDIAESEYNNKIALSPTIVEGERVKLKHNVLIKSNILVSNCNVQYQIMIIVSIYGSIPIKNSLNTSFFFYCLLFSPVGVSLKRIQ
jgi:hypothetical protein